MVVTMLLGNVVVLVVRTLGGALGVLKPLEVLVAELTLVEAVPFVDEVIGVGVFV
jgi:hypothetical protein